MQKVKQKEVVPDYVQVSQITKWNLEISKYFVSEAKLRGVSVWEEALPIISVETNGTYDKYQWYFG